MSKDLSPSSSFQELNQVKELDPLISRRLPDISSQGADITRNLANNDRIRRSSSFSTFLEESRRGSTASDINIPGGFRREYIITQSVKQNKAPPKFLTNNLIEFLNIYSNFAGENLSDEEEDEEDIAVDEESLLLSEQQRKSKPSNVKTYFLVFKALVGSGVLFLPKAFSNGGLLFSVVAMNVFGILTFICYILLIKAKNYFKLNSFGELGFKTYGNTLKILIMISILISQIGFVSTYILFSTKNLSDLLNLDETTLVLAQFFLLVPFVLIRKISKLSAASLVSSAFILIGLVIIFYYSIMDLATEGPGPDIIQFNPNSWSMLIGVAVTSFEGIGLILPIESAMHNPKQFPKVLGLSMIVITLLFTSIGLIGYLAFGSNVETIILLNLPYDRLPIKAILVLYSIAVFLTAPLQLFPAVKILENVVFNSKMFFTNGKLYNSGKHNNKVKWLKNLFRALFTGVICIVAYLNFNNIDKFVSFNGCFACIPLVYIYPPLIHLKTLEKHQSIYRGLDIALATVGGVVVVYSTYQIVFLN